MSDLRTQPPMLDDLLREIKKLSARMKEGKSEDSTSSKEGTITSQPASGKKMPKKRQKGRNKKQRGRKRQLKYADLDVDSSSFTDCTDEDIIRDYIENITANLSDSDVDATLKKGAFLVRRDFSPNHDFHLPWSPEVDETDSFSESFLLTKSHKKRRRYKRHSMEHLEHQLKAITPEHQDRIQALANQFKRSKNLMLRNKKLKLDKNEGEEDMEIVEDNIELLSQDSSQATSSTDNSESSSNSHSPGSEADDEGEESCIESSAIKQIIPWWEEENDSDSMAVIENDQVDGFIEHSLNLMSGRQEFKARKVMRTPMTILCESGGFVAYANHKIKNFVHQRDPNELSLYTTNKKEQEQVLQLATLYNLHCLVEEAARSKKVVLTKTLNTKDADQDSLKLFLSREVKLRCRKNRPPPQWNSKRRKMGCQSVTENNGFPTEHTPMEVPIPDTNVGNQILRSMGWQPGQGLGKDNSGITNPVKAVKRPRNLGLGHPPPVT